MEIKFTEHRINGVNFKSSHLDADYIGWKYNIPNNDDIVIGLNEFFKQRLRGEFKYETYQKILLQFCN